jgi:hypothetical protein
VDFLNEPENLPQRVRDLIEDYLDGGPDEAGLRELEEYLQADAAARHYFVRYARLHTDLYLEVRAQQASELALDRIEKLTRAGAEDEQKGRRRSLHFVRQSRLARGAVAAACLVAVGLGSWLLLPHPGAASADKPPPTIAWLVNAQNCRWAAEGPAGDMQAGRSLKLEQGLAEIRFQCGARVILQGPVELMLVSASSARLQHGKMTVRVPGAATGFEILSPQGNVIDLGTEFGISVSADGATDVYVFEGKVSARPSADGQALAPSVSLLEHQAARMAAGQVTVQPKHPGVSAEAFVRNIVPPPVIRPRTLHLRFDRAVPGTICDARGIGTGLSCRLPGTGTDLDEHDANLLLNPARGQLELTTTNSDLNTQYKLHHGEYLGLRLSQLGFTGQEDFAVTVTMPNIPQLDMVGQFGLYAAAASDESIRGGLIISPRAGGQYTQFLVSNHQGSDNDPYKVGLLSTGSDLRFKLRRTKGTYSLSVENLTKGSTSTLTIPHPEFLDDQKELFVGLFGANTQSDLSKTLIIKDFQVTVWTVSPPD